MPGLKENDKHDLKETHGFTDDDIELFDMYSLQFNVIRDLQNTLVRHPGYAGIPLEQINRQIMEHINREGQQQPFGLNGRLTTWINIQNMNRSPNQGGKRRRKHNGKKTRRKGRKRRRMSRRH